MKHEVNSPAGNEQPGRAPDPQWTIASTNPKNAIFSPIVAIFSGYVLIVLD